MPILYYEDILNSVCGGGGGGGFNNTVWILQILI